MLLAEVLLATTLLLVVALLLLGLIPTAGNAMAKSRKHGLAVGFCRQELQKARIATFKDLTNGLRTAQSQEVLKGRTVTTSFQIQRRVTTVSERLKKVEATVSWPDSGLAYVRMVTVVRGEP
jgi:hypothetical protein